MTDLSFAITGVRAEVHAAVPTLTFGLRVTEATGTAIHAIVLRTQARIEPRARRYSAAEEDRLLELYGEPSRWRDTLKSLLWTHATVAVPSFTGCIDVALPITCTYDFEVASSKYFHALDGGDVLLHFLMSGTVFVESPGGFRVEQIPWEKEASFRLPQAAWREMMDSHFPGSAWIRLRRETFDKLHRFRGRRALPTWDEALETLLAGAEERERT